MSYCFDTPLPFSPVPDQQVEMKFDHDRDLTFTGNPMRWLWETAYRDAAHDLLFGAVDSAKLRAQDGRDLEDAYIARFRRRGAR